MNRIAQAQFVEGTVVMWARSQMTNMTRVDDYLLQLTQWAAGVIVTLCGALHGL